MRFARLTIVGALVLIASNGVYADDHDDVLSLIKEYSALQGTGDITKQKALMTADRTFVNGGRRLTDQDLNMKGQQASQDRNRKRDPGAQVIVHAVDPIVKVYGDAALASFYWHTNTIWSAEFLNRIEGNPPPGWSSLIVTLVLTKENGSGRSLTRTFRPRTTSSTAGVRMARLSSRP